MLTDAHKPQRMDYSIIIENQGGATNAFIKEKQKFLSPFTNIQEAINFFNLDRTHYLAPSPPLNKPQTLFLIQNE